MKRVWGATVQQFLSDGWRSFHLSVLFFFFLKRMQLKRMMLINWSSLMARMIFLNVITSKRNSKSHWRSFSCARRPIITNSASPSMRCAWLHLWFVSLPGFFHTFRRDFGRIFRPDKTSNHRYTHQAAMMVAWAVAFLCWRTERSRTMVGPSLGAVTVGLPYPGSPGNHHFS